jgi:hypothetical protein
MKANANYEVVRVIENKSLYIKRILICRSEEEAIVKIRTLKRLDENINAKYFQTFNPNIKPYDEKQLEQIYNVCFLKIK